MSTLPIPPEWIAILERRRRFNTSGQDGSDFELWSKYHSTTLEPEQMELFA